MPKAEAALVITQLLVDDDLAGQTYTIACAVSDATEKSILTNSEYCRTIFEGVFGVTGVFTLDLLY